MWIHETIKKSSVQVLRDDVLSDAQNTERLAAFVRHLQEDDDAIIHETVGQHPWRTQWSEVPFLMGIAVLAACSAPQSGWFLLGACLATVLCFFAFLSLIFAQAQRNARIDAELASILPAEKVG